MQTGSTSGNAARDLLTALVDYAGLFPPARLSMREAVAEYRAARDGPFAWMLGRFIVPSSRTAELVEQTPTGEPFELSVILEHGIADLQKAGASAGLHSVRAIEMVLQSQEVLQLAQRWETNAVKIPAYIEFPRDESWNERVPRSMESLARARIGAKVRCGGTDVQAFPTAEQLALFIDEACRAGVPFKATAGLHHPLPRTDPLTGAVMHGFINLLAATALALKGAPRTRLVALLECTDASSFAISSDGMRFNGEHIDVQSIRTMRERAFIAYGSCSFSEPVDDLRALGVL